MIALKQSGVSVMAAREGSLRARTHQRTYRLYCAEFARSLMYPIGIAELRVGFTLERREFRRDRCCAAGVQECLEGVIADLPEESRGLVVLVVDTFVLTLLDSTVGLAAVIDAGFLGKA